MTIRKSPVLLILLVAVLIQSAPVFGQEGPDTWGGQHVAMEVTKTGAQLEFDCASGEIKEPLPLDKPGQFQVKGTFTPEHGGPVRRDEAPATRDATYSGSLENDTLTLRIEVSGQSEAQEYVLRKGQAGRVMRCR